MKKLLILALLLPLFSSAQLYDWVNGTNPVWTSSNPSNRTLSWQGSITTVSTSGFNNGTGNWFTYNNSQITYYTSPIISLPPCTTSSFINISPSLDINLENNFDYLRFEYSLNGGATWITLGNWTGAVGVINPAYLIYYTPTIRFRFTFTSDNSVNSYTLGFTTYVYYADILDFTIFCPVILPTTVISFTGKKNVGVNTLYWEVDNNEDCSYYFLEKSEDGEHWTKIPYNVDCNGLTYQFNDGKFEPIINYYRLCKMNGDGHVTVFNEMLVSIDNRVGSEGEIVKTINTLGQEIEINKLASGVVLDIYGSGEVKRRMLKTE